MTRVAHPILRLEVLRPDGTRAAEQRVFCRYQRRSIDADACHGCEHCDFVTAEPRAAIVCSIPTTRDQLTADASGETTEVGAVLQRSVAAVDPATPIGAALSVLRAEDRRSIAVVDGARSLVGVVHEVTFLQPRDPTDQVAGVMSSALALHESTPLRRALRLLASAHLREATVVDGDGVPLGVFRDVDGLRWLAAARRR